MLKVQENDEKISRYIGSEIGSFQESLHEYLRDEVAKIIKTDGTWSVGSILNHDAATKIIHNIFWWLFDGEPESSLLRIEKLNNPKLICGYVFKHGEPVYSCRDCAVDPTCVFCQKCFRNSEHKQHRYKTDTDEGGGMCDCGDPEAFSSHFRCDFHNDLLHAPEREYKMHTSSGGGCCDCGDVEAWHKYSSCGLHRKNEENMDNEDAVSRLPQVIRDRAPKFFETILAYIVDLLTVKRVAASELQESLQPSIVTDDYITMLFNDESHTFDYVIAMLQSAIKCDQNTGADFATIVDREGRSVIAIDSKKTCEEVERIVKSPPNEHHGFLSSQPLKSLVIHVNIIAHQELALLLLSWLSKLVKQSEGLRLIFSEISLKDFLPLIVDGSSEGFVSPVEVLIHNDATLWKTARNLYHQVIMNSLLLDLEMKRRFSVMFTKLYPLIQNGFLKGDHNHSHSIASFSVQIYTVPTITRYLIINENLLPVILNMVLQCCCKRNQENPDEASGGWCQILHLDKEKMRSSFSRMQFSYYDLKYILANLPDSWSDQLRTKFVEGFEVLLQFLMAMQGMDSVTRKTGIHVEHEPDWETGVQIMMRFGPVIHHALKRCRGDEKVMFMVLNRCLRALKHINDAKPESMMLGTTMFNNKLYDCIDYDISKHPVSSHYPVTRFMAALLLQMIRNGKTLNDIESCVGNDVTLPTVVEFLECSLRCLSLNAQVNASMWRRNGLSLANQMCYYKDFRCREQAFDTDIQILQICAAQMEPDHFIACLLHKMNLNPELQEFAEHRTNLLADFFGLLITVCGERYVPGISDITTKEQIRHHIIHILALESKPHSKISKLLPDSITEKADWEDILHDVAEFIEAKNINGVGKYKLRASCFSEFCPHSFHFVSATQEIKAQNEIAQRKKMAKQSTVFIPPRAPLFSSFFSNVPGLLCCDNFIHILSKFFEKLAVDESHAITDRVVEKVLYLTSMAIIEAEQQKELDPDTNFNFIKKSISGCEQSLLFLLKQLAVAESCMVHRETFRWIIAKIENLSDIKPGDASSSVDQDPSSQTSAQDKENDMNRNARKRKAQGMREKLLSQMKTMQQNFLMTLPEISSQSWQNVPAVLSQSSEVAMELSQELTLDGKEETPVATSLLWQLKSLGVDEGKHTCILCQEDSSAINGTMVMSALVQRSTVFARGPHGEPVLHDFPLFIDLSFPVGLHTSTCSHTMHFECFKQFKDSVHGPEARRRIHHRFLRKNFNIEKNEFLCPLCSRISNTVVPVIPQEIVAKQRGIESVATTSVDKYPSMKEWLKVVEEILTPVKHQKQEFVMRFHVDVSEMDEEMKIVEEDEERGEDLDLDIFSPVINAQEINPQPVSPMETSVQLPLINGPLTHKSENVAEDMLTETINKLTKTKPTSSSELSDGLKTSLEEFVQRTQIVGFNEDVSEVHQHITLWLSAVTTVISAESISRLDDSPILAKGPVRTSSALSGIIRSSMTYQALCSEEQLSDIRGHALSLLSSLIGVGEPNDTNALLNTNIFATFIQLWFSSSTWRKSKSLKENSIVQMHAEFECHLLFTCTLAQIVQCFVFMNVDELAKYGKGEVVKRSRSATSEAAALYQACNQVRAHSALPPLPSEVTKDQLYLFLDDCLNPFIRCCALFLHHVTGVSVPSALEDSNHKASLLSYIGLPKSYLEYFDVGGQLSLDPLIQRWCKHPSVLARTSSLQTHLTFPSVIRVPELISFPKDYSDLIGSVSSFKCPKFASDDTLYPTMCLICGVVLCSQSYCCQQPLSGSGQQVGACTHHTHNCSAGSGIFLRVRECLIVLLFGVTRGCFTRAPYLDRYGETDSGFRRGNPLYLNDARVLDLRKLWLSHGVAERVSHDNEMRGIDWSHL